MKTVSIIIPVFNEENNIVSVIESVLSSDTLGLKKEIIIVDDGSTDNTKLKVEKILQAKVQLISFPENKGKGAALKAGFKRASGDILLVQDADREYNPSDYKTLLRPFLNYVAQVVYGSRNSNRKTFHTKYSYLPFYWGGIALTWIINILFGTRLTDQATGYKVFDARYKQLLTSPRENRFSYEVAVTGLLARSGIQIREVPIHYTPRTFYEGKKIGVWDFIESIFVALRYSLNPLILPLILILYFWKDSIFHLSTQIHDWMDGTFMIWTVQNNIEHFKAFAISKLYETNAMYSFPHSLSMTDHFYFPSFIATLISLFSSNYFLQFNVLTVGNHILLLFSFYLLAGRITRNSWIKTISSFYFAFGPYFFLQMGHLQMVFLWPLILSVYYLSDSTKSPTSVVNSGVWMGLQFLTGTYLGVMGFLLATLHFVCSYFFDNQRFDVIKRYALFLFFFLLVGMVSIYGYFQVNALYHPVREQGQYVSYAAHITDYLFTVNRSFIYSLFPSWTTLNNHNSSERAAFIGFLPLIIFGVWILFQKKRLVLSMSLNKNTIWLIALFCIGFIFSLGPRFNWNGIYKVTPLPYLVLLKLFPPVGIIRATARWYVYIHFAVSVGMVYFLSQIEPILPKKSKAGIMTLLFAFAVLEFYVSPVQTVQKGYIRASDTFLKKQCVLQPGAILEYPFEYRAPDRTVEKFLAAKTNTLMYSTLHTCPTLSGFSSFEPPLFLTLQRIFDSQGFSDTTITQLQQLSITYVRVSKNHLNSKEKQNPQSYITSNKLHQIYSDVESTIYRIDKKNYD